jgi:hypothetical protein
MQSGIWLDGTSASGSLIRPGVAPNAYKVSGVAIGSGTQLPFHFGKQELTGT